MVARSLSTPSRTLGLAAAAIAALCAAGLGLLTASNQTPGLPAEVPWPLLFGAILLTPALIGGLGAASGRRSLLVAAGILCLVQSILAFSGVTLVLLVPALMFLRSAAAAPRSRQIVGGLPVRLIRWTVLVALAAPVAVLAAINFGVLGNVGLIALAAVASILGRRGAVAVGPGDLFVVISLVVLVVGALFVTFVNTETICWNARSTPSGIVYERIPAQEESGVISPDSNIVSSSCAGGQPTVKGAALTGILLIGAIAIAAEAARTSGGSRAPDGADITAGIARHA